MIIASFAEVISLGAVIPFLSVLTSPESLLKSTTIQKIIFKFQIKNPKDLLLPITIFFSITVILSGIMRFVLLWFQTRLCYSVGADFSYNIYRKTLFQKYSIHISRNSSEVISGISNKANSIIYAALLPLLSTLSSILMLFMMLSILLYINTQVTIITVLGFILIYSLIIKFANKKLAYYSSLSSIKSSQVVKAIQEGLGGIRDVLIDGTQNAFCEIYKNADFPLRRAQANVVIIGGSPRFGIESLGIVLVAILAYSLSSREGGIGTAIPTLGAFALAAQRMLPILQQAYSNWTIIKSSEAYLSDTLDLLDQPLPKYANEEKIAPINFTSKIILQNISFKYLDKYPFVLKNLNLEINKGEMIGFIGTTGSGKSTLLDILMGLISPTKGNILIDNLVLDESNFRSWQTHIAHVPQSIFLSDSTIAENIAFGVPFEKIDFKKIKLVCEKAQISDIIETWEKKYLTMVGERGIRLSGGQRQRIGIARALYKNAEVIVFDEATSALDNKTELDVMSSINNLSQELTIIIVAHRLTTLKNCNKIIELKNGEISNIINYSDL
jgi:ATP-binding cassette subfamily B protein